MLWSMVIAKKGDQTVELNMTCTLLAALLFSVPVPYHNFTVQSAEPDARIEPSQLNNIEMGKMNWLLNYPATHYLHHFAINGKNKKAQYGNYLYQVKNIYLKASVHTQEVWPTKGVTQRPLERSHIIVVPSSDAMYRPSGDIARDKILLWPMKILTYSPLLTPHRWTVLSLDLVAM